MSSATFATASLPSARSSATRRTSRPLPTSSNRPARSRSRSTSRSVRVLRTSPRRFAISAT
ncbi:hypothetical protein AMJ85_08815 [candidate division BRC1 bacterium SM23_51]|nr:MAG: hypothetical protein AMJ85_08815 [candidate division BRC1 bacterium SM23_51]